MSPPTTPAPTGEPPRAPPPKPGGTPIAPPSPRAPQAPAKPAAASFAELCAPASTAERDAVFCAVYGGAGLGKSTFASGAPAPFFVPVDPTGTRSIPRSVPRSATPATWTDLLAIVAYLATGEHDRKTLVLDTINAIEALLFAHVCKLHSAASIEMVLKGYGKGFTVAAEMMAAFVSTLHDIRAKRGINIVGICHAKSRTQQDPSLPAYDLWTMAVNEKVASVWIGAADTVIFAQAEASTRQEGEGFNERTKIEHTGRVLAHVRPGLGWVAKNRDFLISPMALSWAVFEQAMSEGADLRERLFAKLDGLTAPARVAAELRLAAGGWSRESVENEIK